MRKRKITLIHFRCLAPITRHGEQLQKGAEFAIKKTSSRQHVDRWLRQGRIEQVRVEEAA